MVSVSSRADSRLRRRAGGHPTGAGSRCGGRHQGIGGYHLACGVDDDAVVRSLRSRKARGAKPFAMLVRDLDVARRYAYVDDDEAAVLSGPARPIVLLRRHDTAVVADSVAPGSPLLGLMLPYSPSITCCWPRCPATADRFPTRWC